MLIIGSISCMNIEAATVTSNRTVLNGTVTYTYTVTAGKNETISDFHIVGNTSRDKIKGTAGEGPANWVGNRGYRAANWYKGSGQAIGPNQQATFKLTIPVGQDKEALVKWKVTNDNNSNPNNGVIDQGPVPPEPSITGPISYVGPDEDTTAVIGTTTVFNITSTEPSCAYHCYAVSTGSDAAPDPDEDWTGFLDWVDEHPVPAAWGLTFQNMSGTLDADGNSSDPRVIVPDDVSLVSSTFYIITVVETQEDDYGISYKERSADREITITQ